MDGRECGGCVIVIEKNVECDEEVLEVGVLDGLREVAPHQGGSRRRLPRLARYMLCVIQT